jgi:hypothetical protein
LADALRTRGYEIVTAPGPGVLRLSPHVTGLYVNALLPSRKDEVAYQGCREATVTLRRVTQAVERSSLLPLIAAPRSKCCALAVRPT